MIPLKLCKEILNKGSKKYSDEEIELIKIYQADPNSKEGMDALDKLVENKMPYIWPRKTIKIHK